MATTLGFVHTIGLITLCALLYVALSDEEGINRTSIENFSHVVYNVSSLHCTWNVGRKDTQYFLYLRYQTGRKEECPHYITNEHGQHVGCHFPKVTIDKYEVDFYVKESINGSQLQFYNKTGVALYEHEKLGPPQNITVNCPEKLSWCTVEWTHPTNSRHQKYKGCFKYEIKDEIRNTIEPTTDNYKNYSGNVKHILKLRAGGQNCPVSEDFGEWSGPIVFGRNTEPQNTLPTISLVLPIFVTILTTLLLIFLCKRYPIWQTLAGPIPQPKLILHQQEKIIEKLLMDPVPTKDEKITLVEDMMDSCKKV